MLFFCYNVRYNFDIYTVYHHMAILISFANFVENRERHACRTQNIQIFSINLGIEFSCRQAGENPFSFLIS